MNAPSLKKTIISDFASLPEREGFENNDVILTTPIGFISGKLIPKEELEDKNNFASVIALRCGDTYDEYAKDYLPSNNAVLYGNDGYLVLVNVKVKSASAQTITHMPFMVVFYDQIIGAGLGTLDD